MTTISRLCTIHGATCRHVLLFASTQIEVAFRRWSAVASLARLPGTAALSRLLDQGVIGSQPMPAHFAAATSPEHFTTKMIIFRHTDACAAHRASSSQVGSERVPVRVWCSPGTSRLNLHRASVPRPHARPQMVWQAGRHTLSGCAWNFPPSQNCLPSSLSKALAVCG